MDNKKLSLNDLESVSGGDEETQAKIYRMLKSGEMDRSEVWEVINGNNARLREIRDDPSLSSADIEAQVNDMQSIVFDYWSAYMCYQAYLCSQRKNIKTEKNI